MIVDALERTKTLGTKELRDAIAATNITDVNHKAMLLPYNQLKFDDDGTEPVRDRRGRADPEREVPAAVSRVGGRARRQARLALSGTAAPLAPAERAPLT